MEKCSLQVLSCLPPTPWSISGEELASRRDFRSSRVFSIDPPTARDLDDALSGNALVIPLLLRSVNALVIVCHSSMGTCWR